MSLCDFRLCAAEKAEAKVKVSNPKTAEKRKSRTLLQSLRDSSLSEGAFVCARFFSAQKGKFLQIFRKYQKRFSESLRVDFCTDSVFSSQSLRRSAPAPFAQGSHESVRFLTLYQRKKAKFKSSKPKVRTFSFCSSAACCHEPSSGRKVSRVSMTEGACETERQQNFSVLPFCGF